MDASIAGPKLPGLVQQLHPRGRQTRARKPSPKRRTRAQRRRNVRATWRESSPAAADPPRPPETRGCACAAQPTSQPALLATPGSLCPQQKPSEAAWSGCRAVSAGVYPAHWAQSAATERYRHMPGSPGHTAHLQVVGKKRRRELEIPEQRVATNHQSRSLIRLSVGKLGLRAPEAVADI
jgi:hypothetical protein